MPLWQKYRRKWAKWRVGEPAKRRSTWWGEAPERPYALREGMELSGAYLFWLLLNAAEPVPALAIFADAIPC